ncbi:MAG: hypothetical protein NUV67_04665 [archaeon]|nr:hypothetical protein [archaeon]
MANNSGNADLGEKEQLVLGLVRDHWPISAIEIAQHLKEDFSTPGHKKRHSTNYTYYLKKLVEKRLVLSKRVGNALVVWPLEAEAYRAIHKIVRGDV